MDDIGLGIVELTRGAFGVIAFLKGELQVGVVVNDAETVALPPPGHVATTDEIALPTEFGARIAQGMGAVVVGIVIETDALSRNTPSMSSKRKGREIWRAFGAQVGEADGNAHLDQSNDIQNRLH